MPIEQANHYIHYAGRIGEEGEAALRAACEGAAADSKKRIFLTLNSLGGSTMSGIEMAYFLKEFGVPISTYIDEKAESAAATVFAGGHERIAHPKSHLYCHPGETTMKIEGWTELHFERYLSLIKSERRMMEQLLASQTQMRPRMIRAMLRERGHKFDAYEARSVGLVHKVERLIVPEGVEVEKLDFTKKSDPPSEV